MILKTKADEELLKSKKRRNQFTMLHCRSSSKFVLTHKQFLSRHQERAPIMAEKGKVCHPKNMSLPQVSGIVEPKPITSPLTFTIFHVSSCREGERKGCVPVCLRPRSYQLDLISCTLTCINVCAHTSQLLSIVLL